MSLTINKWRESRACVGVPTENFFPRKRGIAKKTIEICASCPVRWECLNYSITNGIEYGIWGGMTETERIPLLKAYYKLCGRPEQEAGL